MKRVVRMTMAVAVVSVMALASASAQITPFVTQSGGGAFTNPGYQVGWGFWPDLPNTVQINQLGYYDDGNDGLVASHEVGLYHWNGASADLLVKATIAAGTSAPLEDGFRWASIPTITLSDNTPSAATYIVMATTGGDAWYDAGVSVVTPAFGSLVTWAGMYTASAMPAVGGSVVPSPGPAPYGGPNIGFEIVPEPTSVALALAGLAVFGLIRRQRG